MISGKDNHEAFMLHFQEQVDIYGNQVSKEHRHKWGEEIAAINTHTFLS